MAASNSRRPNHISNDENNNNGIHAGPCGCWAIGAKGRPCVTKTRCCNGENGLEGLVGHHHGQHDARESKENKPNEQHSTTRLTCFCSTASLFIRIMWIFRVEDSCQFAKRNLDADPYSRSAPGRRWSNPHKLRRSSTTKNDSGNTRPLTIIAGIPRRSADGRTWNMVSNTASDMPMRTSDVEMTTTAAKMYQIYVRNSSSFQETPVLGAKQPHEREVHTGEEHEHDDDEFNSRRIMCCNAASRVENPPLGMVVNAIHGVEHRHPANEFERQHFNNGQQQIEAPQGHGCL